MKQNYQKEKKLVISDDLITILVSTRMGKKCMMIRVHVGEGSDQCIRFPQGSDF